MRGWGRGVKDKARRDARTDHWLGSSGKQVPTRPAHVAAAALPAGDGRPPLRVFQQTGMQQLSSPDVSLGGLSAQFVDSSVMAGIVAFNASSSTSPQEDGESSRESGRERRSSRGSSSRFSDALASARQKSEEWNPSGSTRGLNDRFSEALQSALRTRVNDTTWVPRASRGTVLLHDHDDGDMLADEVFIESFSSLRLAAENSAALAPDKRRVQMLLDLPEASVSALRSSGGRRGSRRRSTRFLFFRESRRSRRSTLSVAFM